MIEDLFGNIGAQQEKLRRQLDEIEFHLESPDGAVRITLTAAKTIKDIRLDKEKLDPADLEQWEDILLVTLNQGLKQADEIAAKETQNIIGSMLPPGFGDFFG